MKGYVLALFLALATVALIMVGTLWPNVSGSGVADSQAQLMGSASSPQGAVRNLLQQIASRDWRSAYASLANKSGFSEPEFTSDVTGSNGSLRTYATLDGFDIQPLHASAEEAQVRARMRWALLRSSRFGMAVMPLRASTCQYRSDCLGSVGQ